MNPKPLLWFPVLVIAVVLVSCKSSDQEGPLPSNLVNLPRLDLTQVPTWSRGDLDFFLHGSMSTEMIPEDVLRAFIRTYPDLFPKRDLSNFGFLPDPASRW